MGDKKLNCVGPQTGFNYYDAYAFYKAVINEPLCLGGDDEKWALDLLAWLNGLVFPREFAAGDDDSGCDSIDEREEVRLGRVVRRDMEESEGEEYQPEQDAEDGSGHHGEEVRSFFSLLVHTA
jgi:hypothetical protein